MPRNVRYGRCLGTIKERTISAEISNASGNRPDKEMGLEKEFLTEATDQQGNHQLIAGVVSYGKN